MTSCNYELQSPDVVLSSQLLTAKVEAVSASHPLVAAVAAAGAVFADCTFVAFGTGSLLVLHHSPLRIDVYTSGVLDTSINSRFVPPLVSFRVRRPLRTGYVPQYLTLFALRLLYHSMCRVHALFYCSPHGRVLLSGFMYVPLCAMPL